MKTIVLSVAQMISIDGDIHQNLDHAASFVAEASRQGAHLILFPEFMPQGYRLTPELWSCGERFDGPTVSWLRAAARQYNLYIGTSFLEARDGHFFNTFALAAPNGTIVGKVHKRSPSIWEAYFFKEERGSQYLDTELGRIGVGICFDNHTYEVACEIARSQVDLMLMPHSYCTPTVTSRSVTQADIDRLNHLPGMVARMYNQWFGVPVVLCNKSGIWDSPVPKTIFGQPKQYRFSGRSVILDAGGQVRAQSGDEEGLLTAAVTCDPNSKKRTQPPKYSRYIYPGPAGRELFRILEAVGRRQYETNPLRKQAQPL